MLIERLKKPACELVPIEEIKAHLRIEHNVEDEILRCLHWTAYDWIEQFTRRSILKTTWKYQSPPLKGGSALELNLPFPLVQSVDKVCHLLSDRQLEEDNDYRLSKHHDLSILHLKNKGAPVEVVYQAGYGQPDQVPEAYKYALKVLLANWYQNREGGGCGIPETVNIFLRPYIIWRIF